MVAIFIRILLYLILLTVKIYWKKSIKARNGYDVTLSTAVERLTFERICGCGCFCCCCFVAAVVVVVGSDVVLTVYVLSCTFTSRLEHCIVINNTALFWTYCIPWLTHK